MPSYPGQPGFLPACPPERVKPPEAPRGRPPGPARPHKPRAQDMDESLGITHQMKLELEALTASQKEAIRKMKDSKSAVNKLREQVQSMQSQIEGVLSDKETSAKATDDLKGEVDKLENEHAVLHATHTWTKSSLDSALAAQEEYRKGYNSLQAAFKKAKEALDKATEELDLHGNAPEELNKARGSFDERKAQWKKELDTVNATMQRIAAKHKGKSKAVLDRMLSGQATSLMTVCFTSWMTVHNDVQLNDKAQEEVKAAKAKITEFSGKKTEEAKQFLNRMTAASNSGLVSLMFKNWLAFCVDIFKERKAAKELATTMRNQKLEARKKLEANLGASMKNMNAVVFKNWAHTVREDKEERELNAKAEAAMKTMQKQKRSQNMGVVTRMAEKKEQGLLQQMTLMWKICVVSEITSRYREAEAGKRLETIQGDIDVARKLLAAKKDDLEDSQEELAEVLKKNKAMKDELLKIMDLEDYLEKIQEEMDKDD